MRMLNKYVLVQEIQNNGEITPGGVVLPETLEQQYELGAVAAVDEAEDANGNPVSRLKVGNLVAYHANSGVRFRVDNHGCRFLLEANVMAVLEEAPKAVEEAN